MPYKIREKQRLYQRDYYQNRYKKVARKRQREKRWALREWLNTNILANVECERCGEDHPACLDFHHINPAEKVGNVGIMLMRKFNIEKVFEEIGKCQVLCANCHRKQWRT